VLCNRTLGLIVLCKRTLGPIFEHADWQGGLPDLFVFSKVSLLLIFLRKRTIELILEHVSSEGGLNDLLCILNCQLTNQFATLKNFRAHFRECFLGGCAT